MSSAAQLVPLPWLQKKYELTTFVCDTILSLDSLILTTSRFIHLSKTLHHVTGGDGVVARTRCIEWVNLLIQNVQ